MSEVQLYEIENLQNQIYDLVHSVRDLEGKIYQLEIESATLCSELNSVKINASLSRPTN